MVKDSILLKNFSNVRWILEIFATSTVFIMQFLPSNAYTYAVQWVSQGSCFLRSSKYTYTYITSPFKAEKANDRKESVARNIFCDSSLSSRCHSVLDLKEEKKENYLGIFSLSSFLSTTLGPSSCKTASIRMSLFLPFVAIFQTMGHDSQRLRRKSPELSIK